MKINHSFESKYILVMKLNRPLVAGYGFNSQLDESLNDNRVSMTDHAVILSGLWLHPYPIMT